MKKHIFSPHELAIELKAPLKTIKKNIQLRRLILDDNGNINLTSILNKTSIETLANTKNLNATNKPNQRLQKKIDRHLKFRELRKTMTLAEIAKQESLRSPTTVRNIILFDPVSGIPLKDPKQDED